MTLAKAIDVCRAQEMIKKQTKPLKGSEEQAAESQSKEETETHLEIKGLTALMGGYVVIVEEDT